TRQGRYEQALDHADRELVLRRRAGDISGEVRALCDAALAWQELGHHDTTIALCQNAIAIYQEVGKIAGEAIALPLETIATSLERTGDLAGAVDYLRDAAAALDALDHPRGHVVRDRLRDLG